MTFTSIEVEQLGAVKRVWLAREKARNAQDTTLLDELDQVFREAADDDGTRVILLAGRGAHFSAGHDLKESQANRPSPTTEQRYTYEAKRYYEYCMRMWDFPKPTIVQVQGACVAAGFMVANRCDLVVASDDAVFSDPVTHSLSAAAVEILIHPYVMGLRKAKELLFLAGKLGAEEACRIGMVNKVVPRAELDATTLEMAQRMADAPPFAMRLLKKSLNRTFDAQGFRTVLDAHFDTHQLSHASSEYAAMRAKGLSNSIERAKKLA